MKHTLEWYADIGDDYLMRVAPYIRATSESKWPEWFPTGFDERVEEGRRVVRKTWAHTSTPQLKRIKDAYDTNKD